SSGTIQDRFTTFDDGVQKFETFESGLRRSTEQQDNPGGFGDGAKAWKSILTNFESSGTIQDRFTTFDDGVQKFETFENGLRRSTEQQDNPGGFGDGAEAWTSILTNFDSNGLIQDRTTIFDDGVQKFEAFENGIRRSTEQQDNPGGFGDGAKSWASILTNFDTDGVITDRTTIFDDGRERREIFEDGQIVSIEIVPQPGSGEIGAQTAFFYDDTGELIGKVILLDNGAETREYFLDGALRQRIEIDEGVALPINSFDLFDGNFVFAGLTPLPPVISDFPNDTDTGSPPDLNGPVDPPTQGSFGGPGAIPSPPLDEPQRGDFSQVGSSDGAKSWTARVTTFEENGDVQSRYTLRDDEIELRDIFSNNTLRQRLESDLLNIGQAPGQCTFSAEGCTPEPEPDFFGAVTWTNRLTEFDANGDRLLQLTEFDDTDIEAFLFTANVETQRQQFDGDDDETWFVRVTDFAPDDDTTTLFNEGDTLPEDVVVVPPEAPSPPTFGVGEAPSFDTFA
ncbi:MAG: hypothetical protein AAF557_06935, partial [Pseudomonadota bacterium]